MQRTSIHFGIMMTLQRCCKVTLTVMDGAKLKCAKVRASREAKQIVWSPILVFGSHLNLTWSILSDFMWQTLPAIEKTTIKTWHFYLNLEHPQQQCCAVANKWMLCRLSYNFVVIAGVGSNYEIFSTDMADQQILHNFCFSQVSKTISLNVAHSTCHIYPS